MNGSRNLRARCAIGRSLTALLAIGIWSTPGLAQKTDVIVLQNGDHLTGEIKELTHNKLRLSTHSLSTVYIKWQDIREITSDKTFEIELSSGQKYFGAIQPAPLADQLEVVLGEQETIGVRHLSVVRITPIKRSFWSLLDGSVDLGLSFLQQNNQFDYNLGVQVKYTEVNSRVQLKINSIVRVQNEVSTTNRQDYSLAYLRSFGQRWLWSGLGSFASNAELDLDARASGGGGVGRFFVQTNKFTFATWAGLLFSREQFAEQEAGNALSGNIAFVFEFFRDEDRKSDVSVNVDLIPVLTQAGRVRLEASAEGRHEFFKDFFFKATVFDSFDSKPPTGGATNKNDFGVTTSVGWSF